MSAARNFEPGADHPAANFKVLPLLGPVGTGIPLVAIEAIEDLIEIPGQIAGTIESAYLLRVKGDAMSHEGIMPRDLVVVSPQTTAVDGDLVVTLIGDEALLSRIKKTNSGVWLTPSNPAYEPINVVGEDSQIIGKVIGLIRDYEGAAF